MPDLARVCSPLSLIHSACLALISIPWLKSAGLSGYAIAGNIQLLVARLSIANNGRFSFAHNA